MGLPVTITLLMQAAASSCSTGFISCFRRLSITRRPRNTSPDSASSLGARTETHVLFPMSGTERERLSLWFLFNRKAIFGGKHASSAGKHDCYEFKASSAQQAPTFLQLQPSRWSLGRSNTAETHVQGDGQGFAGTGCLKPANYSIQNYFLLQSQYVAILKHNNELSLRFNNSF